MITVYPYETLGHADHGWLNARHHFSFANYYNPKRMGFGPLRVINDDIIQAGSGFGAHPHKDMEIITYVREGAITHKDSSGNEGRTKAGDVQVMTAGTGIYHSEYNLESEDTNIYQIWIEPNARGLKPNWGTHEFPTEPTHNELKLLVSGDGEAPLFINQDARIFAGNLAKDTQLHHAIREQAYLLVSHGEIEVDGKQMKKGDGAEIVDLKSIDITALKDSNILIIDVPN